MDQVRSRPDLCGAFCMNGDKERAQPSRPQQFSFGPLFAPVSASWLGSLAALSAATRTRAPKRATGIQKPSHRGPAFGEARFSLTQQSTGLLLPVSTPRWGVRKPEFVSRHYFIAGDGESGAAPPAADAASRFQGSAPFGGHECGRRTADATRAQPRRTQLFF